MKHQVFFLLFALILSFPFSSCEKQSLTEFVPEEESEISLETRTRPTCDEVKTVDLVVNWTKVGEVHISASGGFLYVNIVSFGKKYAISGADVFAGLIDKVPLDENRKPDYDRFPYRESFTMGKSSYTFVLDLMEVPMNFDRNISVLTHVELVDGSSLGKAEKVVHAFAKEDDSKKVGWAAYVDYSIDMFCMPGDAGCLSAFAQGKYSFEDLGIGNSKNGSVIEIPEELFEIDFKQRLEVYARSENNPGVGKLVGYVFLSYYSPKQTIELIYEIDEKYCMSETHIYYSNVEPPTKMIPGQYKMSTAYGGSVNSDVYRIYYEGTGDFWIVAQAQVCDFCF